MASEEKPKRGRRILLILIFTIPLMIVASLGTYFYVQKSVAQEYTEGQEIAAKDIRKMTLDTFTVNLGDNSYRRYLRTTITVEYLTKDVEEELKLKMHRIKDIVIEILREKKVEDINSPEKTKECRSELLNAINAELQKGKLTGLYFEEFIIQ